MGVATTTANDSDSWKEFTGEAEVRLRSASLLPPCTGQAIEAVLLGSCTSHPSHMLLAFSCLLHDDHTDIEDTIKGISFSHNAVDRAALLKVTTEALSKFRKATKAAQDGDSSRSPGQRKRSVSLSVLLVLSLSLFLFYYYVIYNR